MPHLLIVDAVEGLETLVGDIDSFGLERSRRSRVAQLLRSAEGRCHLLLVVEEGSNENQLDEEFVSDVVIRLGTSGDQRYSYRTISIVKARGQEHVRGEHRLLIR